MLNKNIKEQILGRIKEKNLTIPTLEQKAGLNKGTAKNIILNRSLNPTIETLHAIAEVLGCTVDDLISNDIGLPQNDDAIQDKKDYEFIVSLFQDIIDCLLTFLKEKNIEITLDKALYIIKETYSFCLTKRDKQIDKAFIEWFIENNIGKS